MARTRTAFSLLWQLPLAASVFLLLFAASIFSPSPPSGVAGVLVIGVDAIPDGSNTASSLGTIDECREVSVGQTFDVDAYIQNADDLRGIDFRFGYNPSLLTVVSANANFLISGFGEPPLEESSGVYFVGQGSSTAQAGNGVLARFTLQANAAGLSEASIRTLPLPPYLSSRHPLHVPPPPPHLRLPPAAARHPRPPSRRFRAASPGATSTAGSA
jgi:hypothetical protein